MNMYCVNHLYKMCKSDEEIEEMREEILKAEKEGKERKEEVME